jgi:gamma-glutamyltranspeptidase
MDPEHTWQRRAPGRAPVVIKNGLEEPYRGTVAELVAATRALTLISRDGAEVQVVVRRTVHPDYWEGEILRVGPTGAGLTVGATVSFEASDIQGGTI